MKQSYLSLDIVRGLAALSVLISHWGSFTVSYAGLATKDIIKAGHAFVHLLWAGGGYIQVSSYLLCLVDFVSIYPRLNNPEGLMQLDSGKFLRYEGLSELCQHIGLRLQ